MRIWRQATGTLMITIVGVSGLMTFPGTVSNAQKNIPETAIISTFVREVQAGEEEDIHTVTPPERLIIPSIGVNATVEQAGLTGSGQMENPTTWDNVAWYKHGPRPGEDGSAVIAGHLDSKTAEAVFWDLEKLKQGDEIHVVDMQGKTHTYVVTTKQTYAATDVPMEELFRKNGDPQLVLVTCDGEWRGIRGYEKRLVVYASAF